MIAGRGSGDDPAILRSANPPRRLVVMPAHWAWVQVGRRTEAERKLLRTMFVSERGHYWS
jgi:hypothetical protein